MLLERSIKALYNLLISSASITLNTVTPMHRYQQQESTKNIQNHFPWLYLKYNPLNLILQDISPFDIYRE